MKSLFLGMMLLFSCFCMAQEPEAVITVDTSFSRFYIKMDSIFRNVDLGRMQTQ